LLSDPDHLRADDRLELALLMPRSAIEHCADELLLRLLRPDALTITRAACADVMPAQGRRASP
jgi:hypothetical protein